MNPSGRDWSSRSAQAKCCQPGSDEDAAAAGAVLAGGEAAATSGGRVGEQAHSASRMAEIRMAGLFTGHPLAG